MFIHSSDSGHLGCFHMLSIVNAADLNTNTQIPSPLPALNSFGVAMYFKSQSKERAFPSHLREPHFIFSGNGVGKG